MDVSRASRALRATATQFFEPLGEQFVQLGERTTLEQHVPVRTRGLDLLRFRLDAVDELGDAAVQAALPGHRWLRVVGEGDVEVVPLGAGVLDRPARREVVIAVGLVADSPEPAASQHTVRHDVVLSLRGPEEGSRARSTSCNVAPSAYVPSPARRSTWRR